MSRIGLAFLRRDFSSWVSYRLTFVSYLSGVVLTIGMVYFMGNTVAGKVGLLEKYGGDYAAFLLSGIAFADLFTRGLGALPRVVRESQQNGTLEPMLATPLRLHELVFASSLFSFILSAGRSIIMVLAGIFIMGFWQDANWVLVVLLATLGGAATFSVSVSIAACVLLLKQADTITTAYTAVAALLGGVVFPVEALPEWVQPLSWLIPLSHALSGLRLALQGASLFAVLPQLLTLVGLTLILLPLSLLAFSLAMRQAKIEGSLIQY